MLISVVVWIEDWVSYLATFGCISLLVASFGG